METRPGSVADEGTVSPDDELSVGRPSDELSQEELRDEEGSEPSGHSSPDKGAAAILASLRDSKSSSSQRRDSKGSRKDKGERPGPVDGEIHGESWGHGGRPGASGVWKRPQEHYKTQTHNAVMCCIYCNDDDPRACVLSRRGLCVPNLSTMGGKLIAGAFVCAGILGILVLRTQSMHLRDEPDLALATASPVIP